MKKPMIIIIGVVVLLFGGLFFANKYKTDKKIEEKTSTFGNPYNKDHLEEETIDQLDDPLYQNQIIPKDLDKKLEDEETMTVYFYSPTCKYCQMATPVVVPLTEELGIDMKKVNLLEFNHSSYWNRYSVDSTPTIVHYENGKEVARLEGNQKEEVFKDFFEQNVVNNEE